MGPVCSRRYYNPLHQPNKTQVEIALGRLAISGLPDHIVDGFLKVVDNDHQNARKACNLLIYWASCHLYDRDEVFKCSSVIRDLGYVELAAKLETDRTDAAVLPTDDSVAVWVPDRRRILLDLAEIPGAARIKEPNGHKIGYKVPIGRKPWAEAVLGVHLGGKFACGPTGVWRIPRRMWSDVLRFKDAERRPAPAPAAPPPPPPPVVAPVTSVAANPATGKVEVRTPYNAAFKDALKAAVPSRHREWTGTCWAIDPDYEDTAKGLVAHHFGKGTTP